MRLMEVNKGVISGQIWGPLLWSASLFIVLPNALFWALGVWFDLGRPIFNLDYLFAGVVLAMGWGVCGGLLLGVLFIIEVLMLIGQFYPFLRLHDLVYLAGLLPQAPGALQIFFVCVVLGLVGAAVLVVKASPRTNLLSALIPLNIGLLMYGVHVYADYDETERFWRAQKGVVVDSQSINFVENRLNGFVETFSLNGEPFFNTGFRGRSASWHEKPVSELNSKMLLVVAESWGYFKDERLQQAIIQPVLEKKAGFEWLKQGEMEFQGATVAAEFRELCGLRPNHFNLKSVEAGFEPCLPQKLKNQGYSTSAVHGAVGLMYDRIYWYPRAGFDELEFRETRSWKSTCYSFPGTCDEEIARDYVRNAFAGTGKKFVYWLTLNTHSIYDRRDLHSGDFDCADYSIPQDSELCRMAGLHAQFFRNLADILDDASMKGVEVLVVGDHAPPLVSTENKGQFIKEGMVSWMHFRIKDEAVAIARAGHPPN